MALFSVLGGAIVLLGLLITFLGARLLKPVLFLTAFIIAGFFSLQALDTRPDLSRDMATLLAAVIALAAGILSIVFYKVGFFLLGALALMSVTDIGLSWVRIEPPLVALLGAALVGGVVVLVLEKRILIFVTSAMGSTVVIYGVTVMLLPATLMQTEPVDNLGELGRQSPWERVILLVMWVGLWAAGVKVQSRRKELTAEDAD